MAKKKTVTKKAAKKVAPAKGKKSVRGKRYSDAEKKTVVDFVNGVNAKKGRGGVAAAVRKFGTSALTINAWVKATGGAKPKAKKKTAGKRGRPAGRVSSGSGKGTLLQQLVGLESDIIALENDLAAKRAEFDQLKKKL